MNCLIVDDDEQIRLLVETLIKETDFLHLVKNCQTAIEASNALLKEKIDLIFLDVLMPGMTGLEFLKTLEGNKPQIIMITANKEFAADAFDFDVCDFIVKPITHSRFLKAVAKAKKIYDSNQNHQITRSKSNDAIFVKSNSALVKLNAQDIYMVEALVDYVAVHTNAEKFIIHSTMKEIKTKLPENDFIRVHNSYIVRVDKITSIEGSNLIVNHKIIPISRSKQKDLMNRLKLL
jgi:two-component system LytT family response regulator